MIKDNKKVTQKKKTTKKVVKKKEEQKKRGRPSKYSIALCDRICKRMANGESLLKICKDDSMPHRGTVITWLNNPKYKIFRDNYVRALNERAEFIFEDILEIADEKTFVTEENQRNKLRVETRKWVLARMQPKKFGNKLEIDTQPEKVDLAKLTDEELMMYINNRNK